ncbi:FAD-dependent oxidoreductase [Nocardia sp. NPDC059239]|uniref:FAD-dependent oxidoreductase n=1 Tax=unclassified Nocardia TaxID=2637762 RepID=UPI00368EA00C
MAHVITRSCCTDASCIAVCPVNCIHPSPGEPDFGKTEMLYIDPAVCVDCGACVAACPAAAIVHEYELSEDQQPYLDINALWFAEPGHADYSRTPIPLTAKKWSAGHLRVAIVGSGPAGFYAADELLTQHGLDVEVDMFERLPVPGGLVRYGVAPDHQDTKSVAELFETTMSRKGFRLYLNTEIGADLSMSDLAERYHAVIVATGALRDRPLGVPGEQLAGCHSATEFVAWYNGHPDFRDRAFDLSGERAVIVGNGNVALDVARILVSGADHLARTDIADHAWAALGSSKIREVTIIGRRGPGQAAFAAKELLSLVRTPGISVELAEDLDIEQFGEELSRSGSVSGRFKLDLLRGLTEGSRGGDRKVVLRFLAEPIEILGRTEVEGIRLRRTELEFRASGEVQAVPTDVVEDLHCGLVLSAVGFRGSAVPGIPFDDVRGVIPNRCGTVVDPSTDAAVPGRYVVGWIKRGPSGVIGTNKTCAQETVAGILAHYREGRLGTPDRAAQDIPRLAPGHILAEGWRRIDQYERVAGRSVARPRVKLVDIGDMLAVARGGPEGPTGLLGVPACV